MKLKVMATASLCFFGLVILVATAPVHADVMHGVSYNNSRDYPGGDYASFMASNLEQCIKHCATDKICTAFSFQQNSGKCRLKNHMSNAVRKRGIIGGYKLSTLDKGNDNRISNSRDMNTMRGVNLSGGDYEHFLSRSVSKCSDRCSRDSKCASFTYHKKKGACWLKSSVPGKRYDDAYISGIKRSNNRGGRDRDYERNRGGGRDRDYDYERSGDRGRDRDFDRSRGDSNNSKMTIMKQVNLPGADYVHFDVKKTKHCSRRCLNDPKCRAFTFNKKTRTCWLKSRRPGERFHKSYVSGVKVRAY